MNSTRCFRRRFVALVPVAAMALSLISLGPGPALAQTPPAASQTPAPAASTPPAATATPVPPPAENKSPADSPAAAAAAARCRAGPDRRSLRRGNRAGIEDGRGLEGNANWDSAFDTLIDSFKSLTALLDKQGIKHTGNPMIVYTSTDDTGFTYLAEIPVDQEPKNLGKDMSIGKSPDGKALKFVHRGSYDNMDNTYEAITNHLDDKKLEAKDTFIEEYITDPLKTAEDKLVINVYVPLK